MTDSLPDLVRKLANAVTMGFNEVTSRLGSIEKGISSLKEEVSLIRRGVENLEFQLLKEEKEKVMPSRFPRSKTSRLPMAAKERD